MKTFRYFKFKAFKAMAMLAAMVLCAGAGAGARAQETGTAYVPVRVNVDATVTARGGDTVITMPVTANEEKVLVLPLGSNSVRYAGRVGGRLNAPTVTSSRGNITLRLPTPSYNNADVALYSVNGKRVLRGKADAAKTASAVTRRNVAPGAYLLSAKDAAGNSFTARLTHGGGDMNVYVAFGTESAAPTERMGKRAAAGQWELTVSTAGYNSWSAPLTPTSGLNPLVEVTLTPASQDVKTVTFDANDGNGAPPAPIIAGDGTVTFLPNGNGLTRSGYTFGGWNTQKDGTGTNYGAGAQYTVTASVTLYAKWEIPTITFDANGGSGAPPASIAAGVGTAVALPDGSGLTKSGYTFGGWNTSGSGTGTNYSAGAQYTVTASVTLYARWNAVAVDGTFQDSRDNKSYKAVTIGSQVWMAENLNYNASGSDTYGRLYNWNTAMGGASSSSANPSGVRGVCPSGWHLPSDAEWTTLTDYVGGSSTAGKKLKSTSGWNSGGNGTDEYGFSALPGGYGRSGGNFYDAGNDGYWWSATEYNASNAWFRNMGYGYEYVRRDYDIKTYLVSVRCVQD